MLTIGLLGGIASGKSTVARLLGEQGAAVFDADQFAHQVLLEPEVRDLLVERWGAEILASTGELDRRVIANRVFGDKPDHVIARRFLESTVHPRVRQRLRNALDQHARQGGRVAVLDIPLLIEAGWTDDCDLLLFIDAEDSCRLSRAAERGWNATELAQREASQVPIEEKRAQGDVVLLNPQGDLDALRQAVCEFWATWIDPRLEAP